MSYFSVSYCSVIDVQRKCCKNTFSGSSSFISNGVDSFYKKETVRKIKEDVPRGTFEKPLIVEMGKEGYKLNKSKIRKKIDAFFKLRESSIFCAFFTISFPQGFSDDDGYKCFNVWLTRCRKIYGFKSYIWVAERQKNGTVHFHILSNNRLPIRKVNSFMAATLSSYSSRYNWKFDVKKKYNGVDVDNIWHRKDRNGKISKQRSSREIAVKVVRKYMSKYISKNNIEHYRLPWHCSRDISALFIAQNFDKEEINNFSEYFEKNVNSMEKIDKGYAIIYLSKVYYDFSYLLDLHILNQNVYDYLNSS